MIKQTITYTDFNGKEHTEDFWFNLSEAEMMELEISSEGGLNELISRIVAAEDGAKIVELFKKLLKLGYGVKSLDGKKFVKNDQVWEDFASTNAYSWLFMQLSTDAKFSADFVNGMTNTIKKQTPNAIPPNAG